MRSRNAEATFAWLTIIFWLSVIAAWLTHIIVAIKASAWIFMIAGAVVPFVGVAHGVATWLGYSWGI